MVTNAPRDKDVMYRFPDLLYKTQILMCCNFQGCPVSMYEMMLHCWSREKKNRPTFGYLYEYLNSCCRQHELIYELYNKRHYELVVISIVV